MDAITEGFTLALIRKGEVVTTIDLDGYDITKAAGSAALMDEITDMLDYGRERVEQMQAQVMVKVTTPARAYNADGEHIGAGKWLDLVHEVNRLYPDTFGTPEIVHRDTVYVEVYPDAEVQHIGPDDDQTVIIASTSSEGSRKVRRVADNLGLTIEEV